MLLRDVEILFAGVCQVSELEAEQGGAASKEECDTMRRENEELKEVLTAVQLDLEARQSELAQRDLQLKDTNAQLVAAKARIAVSLKLTNISLTLVAHHTTRLWRRRMG